MATAKKVKKSTQSDHQTASGIPLGKVSLDPTRVQELIDQGFSKTEAIAKAASEAEVSGLGPSEARQDGRRLTLKFIGGNDPFFKEIAFLPKAGDDPRSWDSWTDLTQALSILFLKYLAWSKSGVSETFYFQGKRRDSFAAVIGNAISSGGELGLLFEEVISLNDCRSRLRQVFPSIPKQNLHGKDNTDRRVFIGQNYLPPDCVEIFWDLRGKKPLTELADLQLLEQRIRESDSVEIKDEPIVPTVEARTAPEAPLPPETEQTKTSTQPQQTPTGGKPSKATPNLATEAETEAREQAAKAAAAEKGASQPEETPFWEWAPPQYTPPPIDRNLFNVIPANESWPDDMPLITFDEGITWTLRNAFEGVFILGTTGSGKTSGSGATLAETFLRSGFGGLVLTVKEDEAEHWRRLCARCGREKDFVVVRRGGDWRMNLLAYEAQRPGGGGGLAKNLAAFCKNLLSISSRYQGQGGANEQYWQSATDQLLNATFELFLLAGGEITFDRLADFVAAAPTEQLPASNAAWMKLPLFGEIFTKAKDKAATAEDMRILHRTAHFWFKVYPGLSSKVRTSITLGVFAMLDIFRGRDIPDLISAETNLTPESIMSGKIVVLDLSVKEYGETGLLVQSAWKFLFQTALERKGKSRDDTRRPVFLWEDEGQYFFSDHDSHFQDTARSSRVCRVILSQNLENFYKKFGAAGGAAANSVFGNLNTKIFHCNPDPKTNEWASKHFGQVIRTLTSISQHPQQQPKGYWDTIRQIIDPVGNVDVTKGEQWEPAVQPSEFNNLKNGGKENGFEVEAYITWPGLHDEEGRHYIKTTFIQNK